MNLEVRFRRRRISPPRLRTALRSLRAWRSCSAPRCSSNASRQSCSPSGCSLVTRPVSTSMSRTLPARLRTGLTAFRSCCSLLFESSLNACSKASVRLVWMRRSWTRSGEDLRGNLLTIFRSFLSGFCSLPGFNDICYLDVPLAYRVERRFNLKTVTGVDCPVCWTRLFAEPGLLSKLACQIR